MKPQDGTRPSDRELAEAVLRAREEGAFRTLYRRHTPRVYQLALRLLGENGSYNYTLHTWNMDQYYWFKNAYLEYQLVSVDKDLNVIARTPVYDRNLSLVMCRPIQ